MYWYSGFCFIPILLLWYSMILVDVFHFTLKYYFFFRFISIFSPFSCSMSTLSCLNDGLDHPLHISFKHHAEFWFDCSYSSVYLSSWSSDHLTLSSLRVHYSTVYLSSWSFDGPDWSMLALIIFIPACLPPAHPLSQVTRPSPSVQCN